MGVDFSLYVLKGDDQMVRIFIDPGHGGNDPGAVANGLEEKNITLDLALRLQALLEVDENVELQLSRSDDSDVGLSARAQLANDFGADYFVSIHVNAGGGTGFESFIYTSAPTETATYQTTVHQAIMQEIDVTDRGEKTANFAVLRETIMPAILTENMFIDTASDAERLTDDAFLQSVALGHARGIAEIFGLTI